MHALIYIPVLVVMISQRKVTEQVMDFQYLEIYISSTPVTNTYKEARRQAMKRVHIS